MDKPSSLLVGATLDVEPNPPSVVKNTGGRFTSLTEVMPRLVDLLNDLETPATWFITHDDWMEVDERFPELVETLHENGEIGCHVHFTRAGRVSSAYEFQSEAIERATKSLRSKGFPTKSFRGGANYFDEGTLRVLEELEYEIDSSVVPSMYNEYTPSFVVDHRACTSSRPYFPSHDDHCRPGRSRILELPIFRDPIVDFDVYFMRFFIGRALRMDVPSKRTAKDIIRRIRMYTGLRKKDPTCPIILSAHPHDFLHDMEDKLANLSALISGMKTELDARFLTLGGIRDLWTSQKGEVQTAKQGPEIILSGGNSINLCVGRRFRVSLLRRSCDYKDEIQ